MRRLSILGSIIAAVAVLGGPAAAAAGGTKFTVGSGPRHVGFGAGVHTSVGAAPPGGHVRRDLGARHFSFNPDARYGLPLRRHVDPRFVGPPRAPEHRKRHPRNVVIVSPPVVVSPPASCWVPGQWTYQWVPRITTSHTWVPGSFGPSGAWIDGHWQPIVVSTGYWQPLWIPDRWAC
jgi:hypothetical protein